MKNEEVAEILDAMKDKGGKMAALLELHRKDCCQASCPYCLTDRMSGVHKRKSFTENERRKL